MPKKKSYDQKHLTTSQRIHIEKGLNDGLCFAAILISTICTITPLFLPTSRVNGLYNKLICLLPAQAMNTHTVFSTYVLFNFGKLIITLPCMILITSCVLSIIALPIAYRRFCRHQVM